MSSASDALTRSLSRLAAAAEKGASVSEQHRVQSEQRAVVGRWAAILTVGSVVGLVWYNVASQMARYGVQTRWEKKTLSSSSSSFSVRQAVVAADFPALYSVLNAFGVWAHLSSKGGQILLSSILLLSSRLETNGASLGQKHWSGVEASSPSSWSSLSRRLVLQCEQKARRKQRLTLQEARIAVCDAWSDFRPLNVWSAAFPDPSTREGRVAFLRIGMVEQLVERVCSHASLSTCDAAILFEQGVCGVARSEIASDTTSADVLHHYFGERSDPAPECEDAVRRGAVNGALGVGAAALGVAELAPLVGAAGGGLPLFAFALLGLSAVGAGVGAGIGAAAEEERCKNSQNSYSSESNNSG